MLPPGAGGGNLAPADRRGVDAAGDASYAGAALQSDDSDLVGTYRLVVAWFRSRPLNDGELYEQTSTR